MRLSGCAALINLSCGCSTQHTVNKTPCARPIPVPLPRQRKWLFGKTQVASVIGPAAPRSPVEREGGRVEPREDRQVSEGTLRALPARLSCISGEKPGKAQSRGAGPGMIASPGPGPLTYSQSSATVQLGRVHRPRVISGQLCGGPRGEGGLAPRRPAPRPRGRGEGGAARPRPIWSLRQADVSEAMPWV